MIFLESLSFIFLILGVSSFLVKDNIKLFNKTYNKFFIANLFFYFSNIIITIFSILEGYLPLFIQMLFFSSLAIVGIKNYSNNKISKYIYIYIMSIFASLIYVYINNISITINITSIEIIAAFLAIYGNIQLNIKKKIKSAFILFILADILYTYFFFQQNVYIFVLQYITFVSINSLSLYKEFKK